MYHAQHISLAENRLEEVEKQSIPSVTSISFIGAMQLCDIITLAGTVYSVQQDRYTG
jgi:hypothetical protein